MDPRSLKFENSVSPAFTQKALVPPSFRATSTRQAISSGFLTGEYSFFFRYEQRTLSPPGDITSRWRILKALKTETPPVNSVVRADERQGFHKPYDEEFLPRSFKVREEKLKATFAPFAASRLISRSDPASRLKAAVNYELLPEVIKNASESHPEDECQYQANA